MRSRKLSVLLFLAGTVLSPQVVPAQSANAGGPAPYTQTVFLAAGEACAFPVSIVIEGKSKEIQAGDKIILTGPHSYATVTNTESTDETTPVRAVRLHIPGSFQLTERPDGIVAFQVDGRNLLWGGTLPTLTLAVGTFTFSLDGTVEVDPLAGSGQRIDVCAMIE